MAPEGATLKESHSILDRLTEKAQAAMARTKVGLLWGTANLFSNPRYMSGAATNPDPEVFAYAAAQVTKILDTTHRMGGQNYVLWGGREGYETLLNTDMKREADQLARFLTLVAEHKQKIGFKGTLLLEPKPKEPTKHQYDYDTASVYAFLQRYSLENEYKVNIEANHAILSGHTFQHEVAYALANNVFGSLDMNRGDPLLGWDTDQFPNDIAETALVMYTLLKGGGFTTGGMNFDAKLRRQSIDPADLFHAHIGGMDVLARSLLIADKMIQDGKLERAVSERYAGWKGPLGESIMSGKVSLKDLSDTVLEKGINPKPRSGGQEALENLVNKYL
jgi:xylose isomerase